MLSKGILHHHRILIDFVCMLDVSLNKFLGGLLKKQPHRISNSVCNKNLPKTNNKKYFYKCCFFTSKNTKKTFKKLLQCLLPGHGSKENLYKTTGFGAVFLLAIGFFGVPFLTHNHIKQNHRRENQNERLMTWIVPVRALTRMRSRGSLARQQQS